MLDQIAAHITEIKLTLAGMVGAAAFIADSSEQLDMKGWEEASLKVLLILSVIFIGKLFLDAQKTHKAEIAETWKVHKDEMAKAVEANKAEAAKREDKMCEFMERQSGCLERIAELTEEQVDHFRAFVKSAVDEKMKTH